MPVMAYCKKCKAEVPVGPVCPHCGQKLAASGVRLSWAFAYSPAADFFCWSAWLRVALPALALLLIAAIGTEWARKGFIGVQALLAGGLPLLFLEITGGALLVILAVLVMRGREEARYVLDNAGAHTQVWLVRAPALRRWLHLLPESAGTDEWSRPQWLLEEKLVPWQELKRVQFWPETDRILLYSPGWWMALALRCRPDTYDDALRFMRDKLKKRPGLLPPEVPMDEPPTDNL